MLADWSYFLAHQVQDFLQGPPAEYEAQVHSTSCHLLPVATSKPKTIIFEASTASSLDFLVAGLMSVEDQAAIVGALTGDGTRFLMASDISC